MTRGLWRLCSELLFTCSECTADDDVAYYAGALCVKSHALGRARFVIMNRQECKYRGEGRMRAKGGCENARVPLDCEHVSLQDSR